MKQLAFDFIKMNERYVNEFDDLGSFVFLVHPLTDKVRDTWVHQIDPGGGRERDPAGELIMERPI